MDSARSSYTQAGHTANPGCARHPTGSRPRARQRAHTAIDNLGIAERHAGHNQATGSASAPQPAQRCGNASSTRSWVMRRPNATRRRSAFRVLPSHGGDRPERPTARRSGSSGTSRPNQSRSEARVRCIVDRAISPDANRERAAFCDKARIPGLPIRGLTRGARSCVLQRRAGTNNATARAAGTWPPAWLETRSSPRAHEAHRMALHHRTLHQEPPMHHSSSTHRRLRLCTTAVLCVAGLAGAAHAGPNPIPQGSKLVYSFNVIGYPKEQSYTGGCGNGHRIFVNRDAKGAQVVVRNSDTGWDILDCNATADHQAVLVTNQVGIYDIYMRILGKPGGHIFICADTLQDVVTGDVLCPLGTIDLTRGKGQSKFQIAPSSMFDASLLDILWTVDTNPDFRIVQFRVYSRPE